MKKIKNIVQKVLSIKAVKQNLDRFNIMFLTIVSSNRLFSIIYYQFNVFTYSREQHANLKARLKYLKNKKSSIRNSVELRRNIHRIEKGLLMRPRRDVFAENYIEYTTNTFVNQYQKYQRNGNSVDKSELQWSFDVLTEYFSTVRMTEKVKTAKRILDNAEVKFKNEKKKPFKRGNPKSKVSYETLLDLSMQRRSIRWFQDKKVPRELIDKALMVGRQSPTACNRSPFEYKFYDDPELAKEIASIPFGSAGYSHNIPTVAVLTGKLDNYFSNRDRHVIYIDASLSAMAFMYALETLGLSSSVINWPDFEPLEIKMQKKLGLGLEERPVMLIAIGYADPDGEIAYSQKKSLDSLRSFNKTN